MCVCVLLYYWKKTELTLSKLWWTETVKTMYRMWVPNVYVQINKSLSAHFSLLRCSINRNASFQTTIEFFQILEIHFNLLPSLFQANRYKTINLYPLSWRDYENKTVNIRGIKHSCSLQINLIKIMRRSLQRPYQKNWIHLFFYCITKRLLTAVSFWWNKNGEKLRREVHYVSFGYSEKSAHRFLHNQTNNNTY